MKGATVVCVGCKKRLPLVRSWSKGDEPYCAKCDTDVTGRLHYPKGSFKEAIHTLLPEGKDTFLSVQFYGLWRDSEGGWSVNDGWTAATNIERVALVDLLAQRWEVFKKNYYPRARLGDIRVESQTLLTTTGANGEVIDQEVNLEIEACCSSFVVIRYAA